MKVLLQLPLHHAHIFVLFCNWRNVLAIREVDIIQVHWQMTVTCNKLTNLWTKSFNIPIDQWRLKEKALPFNYIQVRKIHFSINMFLTHVCLCINSHVIISLSKWWIKLFSKKRCWSNEIRTSASYTTKTLKKQKKLEIRIRMGFT